MKTTKQKIDRQQAVDNAIASLKLEGVEASDYCRSQLDEYLAGRMTTKMMLQMMDECYLEEVVKQRQGSVETDSVVAPIEERKINEG
jgi:hypothetical protein